jgi:hypothetical protein
MRRIRGQPVDHGRSFALLLCGPVSASVPRPTPS